jgi:hypothetical protein
VFRPAAAPGIDYRDGRDAPPPTYAPAYSQFSKGDFFQLLLMADRPPEDHLRRRISGHSGGPPQLKIDSDRKK